MKNVWFKEKDTYVNILTTPKRKIETRTKKRQKENGGGVGYLAILLLP